MSVAKRPAEEETPAARGRRNIVAKRRQNLVFVACFVVAVLAAVGLTWFGRPVLQQSLLGQDEVLPRLAIPGAELDAGKLWRTDAEQDIRTLQEGWDRLQGSLDQVQEKLVAVQDDLNQTRAAATEAAFEQEILQLISTEPPPAPIPFTNRSGEVVPPSAPRQAIRLVQVGQAAVPASLLAAPQLPRASNVVPTPPRTTVSITKPEFKPASYLPSGSFMPAVILGGLDAPTGAVSRDNPHPVLLRVSAEARLPNLGRRDLRECFVLAAGYGDVASERALLRTERISCQLRNGGFLDTQLHGFIVGEDGRAGVRGRLVTKQGRILQRSLVAGIGAGLGEVLRNKGQSTLNLDALDSGLGDLAIVGLSGGLQSSLDRLAEYYIGLAERLHPVIEVGAGRTVDIVVQEGIDLGQ